MMRIALLLFVFSVFSWAEDLEEPYRLETGDAIEVRFYYTPELTDKIQIRPDGYISLGLIGQVLAAGRTVPELEKHLQERYAGTLKNPAISVQVLTYANRRVFVGGEVQRPGLIGLVGEQTVLSAILEAGGLTKTADRSHVLLIRRGPTGAPETQRLTFERKGRSSAPLASMRLRPFDVVLVTESRIARVNRAVEQYVFRFIPANLTMGFTYLINGGVLF